MAIGEGPALTKNLVAAKGCLLGAVGKPIFINGAY